MNSCREDLKNYALRKLGFPASLKPPTFRIDLSPRA